MTYPQFIILAWLIVAGFFVLAVLMWGLTPIGERLNKVTDAGFGVLWGIASILAVVITLICTVVFVTEHNERTKDFNYCESFVLRGHETLMLEYNYFNRDCMIKVDGQWLRIDDSAFGRNA